MANKVLTKIFHSLSNEEIGKYFTKEIESKDKENNDKENKEDKYIFDFNKIIPKPKHIWDKGNLSTITEEIEGKNNCWYEWNKSNWGVKRNAGLLDFEGGYIEFQTDWYHPFPVIREIACNHPDQVFNIEYADECGGENIGAYSIMYNSKKEEIETISKREFKTSEDRSNFYNEVWNIE